MSDFGATAAKLARNPLGIIALFVALIYSVACLTFALGKNIPACLLPWFVGFVIIYPLIVLAVFCWLVVRHHEKLYSPEDFQNQEHFLDLFWGDQGNRTARRKRSNQTPSEPNPGDKGIGE